MKKGSAAKHDVPAAATPAAAAPISPPPLTMASRMARLQGSRAPPPGVAMSVDSPMAEVDGSGGTLKLSSVPRTALYALTTGASSGAISFRAICIGKPTVKTFKTKTGGTMTVVTVLVCVTSDVPPPDDVYDEGVKVERPAGLVYNETSPLQIITKDQVIRNLDDPHAVEVKGQGKGGALFKQTGHICQGSRIKVSCSKIRLDDLPNQWDEYQFSGVRYQVSVGVDNRGKKEGGRDNRGVHFENWDAANAVRLSKITEANMWSRLNAIGAILFGVSPCRSKAFPVLTRNPVFDITAEIEARQEAKGKMSKEKGAAKAAANLEHYGASLDMDAVHDEEEGEETALQLNEKEKNELAREALTPEARRELNNHEFVFPMVWPSPSVLDYLAANEIRSCTWRIEAVDQAGQLTFEPFHDPTARQNFVIPATPENVQQSADKKPEIVFIDPRPVPRGEKPLRLCPVANTRWRCEQTLPRTALPGEPLDKDGKPDRKGRTIQTIDFVIRNGSYSLHAYGIQDPLSMGLIIPQLVAVTPGLNMCYMQNLLALVEGMPANPAADVEVPVRVAGCVVGTDRNADGTPAKKDIPAFFLDLPAGIVSAGLPITYEATLELYKWGASVFGDKLVSLEGDMSSSDYENHPYAKNSPLRGLPYINLFETSINFAKEGGKGQWEVWVVCNFIQKPSPSVNNELGVLLDALKATKAPMANARKLFGKLVVDIANKRAYLGRTPKDLSGAKPEEIAANKAAVTKYATELAKEGGLDKLPFDPMAMYHVFGPLHASGTEPDYSPQTGVPFHCVPFAIKTTYLDKRPGIIDYLGDDFFQDVVLPKNDEAYKAAAALVAKKPEAGYQPYREKVAAIREKEKARREELLAQAQAKQQSTPKRKEPPTPASHQEGGAAAAAVATLIDVVNKAKTSAAVASKDKQVNKSAAAGKPKPQVVRDAPEKTRSKSATKTPEPPKQKAKATPVSKKDVEMKEKKEKEEEEEEVEEEEEEAEEEEEEEEEDQDE